MYRTHLQRLAYGCIFATTLSSAVLAQSSAPTPACGGDLAAFLEGVKSEAVAAGVPPTVADQALERAIAPKVFSGRPSSNFRSERSARRASISAARR
jgi:membrane-bound lytic murein transglycosylase B